MRRGLLAVALGLLAILWWAMPSSALEKKGDTYHMVFSSSNPPVVPIVQAALKWFEEVKAETGGKVEFKVITGGALLQEQEAFRGVQSGIADIATYILDERDGFILNGVVMLPFMNWPSREAANEIYAKLLEEFPALRAEWKGVKYFALSMMPPNHIHTKKKAVREIEDLKGLKIAITGKYAELIRALGAVPVEVPIQDWYHALERGIVDGCLNHFAVLKAFGLLEQVPYHTVFGPGGINMGVIGVIMNEKAWEQLPPEVQDAFLRTQRTYTRVLYEIEDTAYIDSAIQFCKEKGHTFVELTPQQIEQWRARVREAVIEEWIKTCEDKGLPGRQVYEAALKMIAEYSK